MIFYSLVFYAKNSCEITNTLYSLQQKPLALGLCPCLVKIGSG